MLDTVAYIYSVSTQRSRQDSCGFEASRATARCKLARANVRGTVSVAAVVRDLANNPNVYHLSIEEIWDMFFSSSVQIFEKSQLPRKYLTTV